MDNIYREVILDHYKNPRNFGKMQKANASYEEHNPLCGDKIIIQVKLNKNDPGLSNLSNKSAFIRQNRTISDIRFSGEGCAISVASASMLTEFVTGKSIKDVAKITTKDILNMLGIKLTPTRLKCALLPLEILQKTLTLVK
ncbi:SUF system NifU family Fe-S cluster assembly protein [Candidatus Gottesmanbacteria bacterium CG23_combo_of_CG06-09_8_20_14_all_37_19]|uniref:SUF system NifU family Fe-S cluster assembly protein n=2 Tax=Candidatus Gottesmaniibacteriota TaxID=1752720 RepID=A0A1J4TRV9_9BACT|nr:MAG: SUF system NifU family Fe-S cluster assembly protein [Candidatus Gottesmanbacteria bacterium CG1_02_37_22]PIP33078.1 MAG: SUF system NifU family Fe-S cluster assembly protein [Candidatus Gottesmanbacteria bacterium CG23_combo_of_CG06-09_8_20_14_all_37_19]